MIKIVLSALLATTAAAPAVAANDAATRFGAREDVQQISLSPDGNHIAVVQAAGARGAMLIVLDVHNGSQVAVARTSGDPDRLANCRWSTNTRLVCTIFMLLPDANSGMGSSSGVTRLISVNADGKDLKMLSARDSENSLGVNYGGGNVIDWLGGNGDGTILISRNIIPENSTGTRVAISQGGYAVERVDSTTLKRSIVESARDNAVEYITDGHGTVRVMGLQDQANTGYDKTSVKYLYRKPNSRSWEELGTLTQTGGLPIGFDPYAVDRDLNVVYGFDTYQGRKALFSIALDGTKTRTLVLARPDVDVDGLIRVGRQSRVVGASFATDKRVADFFDPELKKLAHSLGRAMPSLPIISFVDASADETKLLLFAGSDVDAGHYYIYDKTSRKLDEVMPVRPQLEKIPLAPVTPVTYPAADGTLVPAYLTLPPGVTSAKNLPAIVMPHGGPEARDEWGFDWLSQFFANRGYAVLQPNFRGSIGYGEAWFQKNGYKSWRVAIGDVNDAGRWLIKQGMADPAKLAIVGWSYGGYAALQSAVLDPTLYKAIVAVAPVTDLETLRTERRNYTDFVVEDERIGHGPHVVQGSPAQNIARFTAPVLMFHGDRDQNVGIGESRMMATRLKAAGKSAELVEFHRLDHYLADSAARAQMLDKMDGFLRATMNIPPVP